MGKKGGKGGKKGRKTMAKSIFVPAPPDVPAKPAFNRSLPLYSFDLVVTRLEVTGVALTDPRKLVVKVSFGDNDLSLTASRTNVSAFKPDASMIFQSVPMELSTKLQENGIAFEVVYDEIMIGKGKAALPKRLTNNVGWNMKEFNYTSTCSLATVEKPDIQIGALEFLCKLFIKCSDYARKGETCKNLDRNISPNDIVFVIGKSANSPTDCDGCKGVLEAEARREQQKDYSISQDPRCGY
ncbi:hypothetical protein KR026_006341 [Drosophila bipectinata]|nr:hypothetical protein KR026_006341 [Drosophila bipectinata]